MSDDFVPPPPSGKPVNSTNLQPPSTEVTSQDISSISDETPLDVPAPPSGAPLHVPTSSEKSPATPTATSITSGEAAEVEQAPLDENAPEDSEETLMTDLTPPSGAPIATTQDIFSPAPAPAESDDTVLTTEYTPPVQEVNSVPLATSVSAPPPPSYGGPTPSPQSPPLANGSAYPPAPPVRTTTFVDSRGATAAPAKKKNRKPLIIALVAVAAVIAIVAGVLIFQEVSRSHAYDQAATAFAEGDYQGAYEGYAALGDYRDSEALASLSSQYVVYEEGKTLYDAGDYEAALSKFSQISSSDISDIGEWINKCDYALADALYVAGDLEGAYDAFVALESYSDSADRAKQCSYDMADALYQAGDLDDAYYAFLNLGDFADSAARATACTQPFPATGLLYQDGGSYYAYCAIDIVYNYSSGGAYYKIYNGSTCVATMFLNANSTQRVYLQPGSYVVKEGTGDIWFGQELAFGKEGYYSTMTYDDSGTDYITLNDGDLVTLTINSGSTGNVSERDEDLSTF